MKVISHVKAAAGGRGSEARRRTWPNRRFIRDARPAACFGSGAFWYSIWRNIRRA